MLANPQTTGSKLAFPCTTCKSLKNSFWLKSWVMISSIYSAV